MLSFYYRAQEAFIKNRNFIAFSNFREHFLREARSVCLSIQNKLSTSKPGNLPAEEPFHYQSHTSKQTLRKVAIDFDRPRSHRVSRGSFGVMSGLLSGSPMLNMSS